MSTNPFKSFIPYLAPTGVLQLPEDEITQADPSGGQWRTSHLVAPMDGEGLIVDLSGAGKLMAVRFNERILPGKVRDEHLRKALDKLKVTEGREPNKKEYAQLRDQVEFDLLPKAFIRRTMVPVIFCKVEANGTKHSAMLVCTSSAKRCDDTIAVLRGAFGETWLPTRISTGNGLLGVLTTLATDDAEDIEDGSRFETGTSAVLKGEDKETVRIKDHPIAAADVQKLLEGGDYYAHELAVRYYVDGNMIEEDCDLECVITDNLVFKRCEMPGIDATMLKSDLFGYTAAVVGTYRQMLASFILLAGGLKKPVDDDEL